MGSVYLSHIVACVAGNAAPFHITHPSTDDYVQIVSPDASAVTLMCSLNITFPAGMTITWIHNGSVVNIRTVTTQSDQSSHTVLLIRGGPISSHVGIYQCVFTDAAGHVVRRHFTLLIMSKL